MKRTFTLTIALGMATALWALEAGCGMGGADGSGAYYAPNAGGRPAAEEAGEPGNEGDSYQAVGTNPFVVAAHDPQSTFSVDVDTASYEIFRRDVKQGGLPQPDSVRLEEYVNYFAYDYDSPAWGDAVPFAITLDGAPSPFTEGTTLLRVGIRGMDPPPKARRPANLVFLVDTSGSMQSPDKLELVKTVLRETLTVLQPSDTVSIVTYAGGTGVALEPTSVADAARIRAVIDRFAAGGSTAGSAGLALAYEQAQAAFVEGGMNHVLLCSDGDFNVGPSSTEALVEQIEAQRDSGITFTVLGFGVGNLNDAMMEAISNKGNGVYGFIADEDQAIDYVHDRLLSTMNFIAKDVKIQIDFNAERVYAYRLLGYENRDIADDQFLDDTIDAGEIGAGHTVTALYEVVLAGGAIPTAGDAPSLDDGAPFTGEDLSVRPGELARVKIRYKDVAATTTDEAHQVDEGLTDEGIAHSFDVADGDLRWAAAVATFAEIVKQSPYGDRAHLPAIQAIVAAARGDDPDRVEFAELLAAAAGRLAE